jgi:hypothetical protein
MVFPFFLAPRKRGLGAQKGGEKEKKYLALDIDLSALPLAQ